MPVESWAEAYPSVNDAVVPPSAMQPLGRGRLAFLRSGESGASSVGGSSASAVDGAVVGETEGRGLPESLPLASPVAASEGS